MIEELYRSIDDWLVDQDSDIRASEIQGLLAGLMAANATVRPDEFVARLAEYADIQPEALPKYLTLWSYCSGSYIKVGQGWGSISSYSCPTTMN